MILNFQKIQARRKAVSPVIATILLIALTVTAAAIVYFVVVPLFKTQAELVIMDYELEDTDATRYADELEVSFQNLGTGAAQISEVVVKKDGSAINWKVDGNITINPAALVDITFSAISSADELSYGDNANFEFLYEDKTISLSIKISAKFSKYIILFEEDFEGDPPTGWVMTTFQTHNPAGTSTMADWVVEENSGNKYWHCTNNNCQFIIKDDPLYDLSDVNMTYDLLTDDDDANGIIFRYDDSGTYANFYIVWFTRDHPSSSNGPHSGEVDDFDWVTPADQIIRNKITVHYVEGDADGFNWYKLAEVDWTRSNNVWYTWRVIADGGDMDLYIDHSSTPFLSWTDTRITHGYIGLVSFANHNSFYDNIYAWNTIY